jgi:hypothetical protein
LVLWIYRDKRYDEAIVPGRALEVEPQRRYNIIDADDLSIAKEFMGHRMQAAEIVTNV